MLKLDPTFSAVAAAAVAAIATSVMLNQLTPQLSQNAQQITSGDAHAADSLLTRPVWAASATGRVEPKEGEIRISSEVPARIVEVIAKTNDRVAAGDVLVKLDSDDLIPKLIAAESEAEVRIRERDEEEATGVALERRKAEDALNDSERARFRAQGDLDEAVRQSKNGGDANAVTAAREKLAEADKKVAEDRAALDTILAKPDLPLPTRLESALIAARTDVAQVENAIERTRVRAPSDGTVLNVWARAGEMAAPSPDAALVLFGDISSLRVRAEVEERDVTRIRVGQRVVVRADAFPDKDFEGVVTQLAPALGSPRITTRGPRRPNDVEVLEVLIGLDGTPPLLTGMRVDAFFRHEASASAAPAR
ncbi:MAG: efflux RND transporter periplasmic adaptor subunit [Hyphomicrobium zavarzinii]|jgi:HlyD family secretion protein|uniref:HlyD family secretion protein n=1 Tax=Hyphomicrobium TaxID=81 RepID=UPI00035FBBA7|nr:MULTISPECIES: efflux RND transporter periplasmic adaptor subunit [Hyphomicrobium]MBL8848009.1 efflux RND transporter periplasmic adaptor subunit [Hyphomicrobium zavarzinii]WBT38254.1 efflux RND transporter periplasmic adaptor subunit [Hyphomicrobium sp. DMF-1]HML43551.1 efflux RND transporter periplasmic adaptor subunit [Hyphomicrobium zavarzinii]